MTVTDGYASPRAVFNKSHDSLASSARRLVIEATYRESW